LGVRFDSSKPSLATHFNTEVLNRNDADSADKWKKRDRGKVIRLPMNGPAQPKRQRTAAVQNLTDSR